MAIERLASGDGDADQSRRINLSVFRGKEQKLELLDYALLTGRPYVITRTILFLRETLKPAIFHYEISRRPVASDHYLLFLRNIEDQVEQLQDSLAMLGVWSRGGGALVSDAPAARAVGGRPREDLAEVHGQDDCRRAVEIAAAPPALRNPNT